MRYMLLIYSAEGAGPQPGSSDFEAEMGKWFAVSNEMAEAGVMLGGDPLQGLESASTVRIRDGKRLVTDGPFAETKEILGGYYILECGALDEALEWAAKLPNAPYGSVEVRPIQEIPGM